MDLDPEDVAVRSRVNGAPKQDGRTSQMIFDVEYLVSYASKAMTLLPGDVIFTGTPAGVGVARQPARFLQPGNTLESWIEGIGTIRNVCR